MKKFTCCFTGHRKLPQGKIEHVIKRLSGEIDNLSQQGVQNFISGGALGFDQLAASMIIAKRELGHSVRLLFALPCKEQDAAWTHKERRFYRELLAEADSIHYVGERYSPDCMEKRNRYMVAQSGVCICALLRKRSGTSQTVSFALAEGVRVINVAK